MNDSNRPEREGTKHLRVGRLALWLLGAAVLLLFLKFADVQEVFRKGLFMVRDAGAAGPLILFVLYVVAAVFMLPSLFLTIGAGSIFGILKGTIIVSLSSTAGASAAFLTARYLARGRITRRFAGSPAFQTIDKAVAEDGWKIVFLTRLSPAFPYNILNYVYGLSNISLRDYVLASWVGMIPGTVMYAYIGSLAADIATLGTEGRARTPAEWGLTAAGFIATVAATVLIARIARKALSKRILQSEEPKEEEIS